MAFGDREFIEDFIGGNNRKRVQGKLDKMSVFDIPAGLHILKSDSAKFLDIDDKGEN